MREPTLDDLARIQSGDREAFHPLVERYTPMLMALAARYADSSEHEDVVQAMWVHVYRKIGLYDPRRGPIGPWIWAAARNVARELVRRRARRLALDERVRTEAGAASGADNPAEQRLVEEERDRRLHDAIAALPRLQRDVVCLRYLEGLSVAETALALSRAEGTVKASLARAIAKLRALLEEYDEGE
ncbi:MAG: RNA polymerase sigma factor [Gemmatimonadota bacterium]